MQRHLATPTASTPHTPLLRSDVPGGVGQVIWRTPLPRWKPGRRWCLGLLDWRSCELGTPEHVALVWQRIIRVEVVVVVVRGPLDVVEVAAEKVELTQEETYRRQTVTIGWEVCHTERMQRTRSSPTGTEGPAVPDGPASEAVWKPAMAARRC
jgi:hypothetical protein